MVQRFVESRQHLIKFMFRTLTKKEEKVMRRWARDNYKTFGPISGLWHPVVQDECVKMNTEGGPQTTKDLRTKIDSWLSE
jgi:hypothetical protein